MEKADFFIRFVAWFVDSIILSIVYWLISVIVGLVLSGMIPDDAQGGGFLAIFSTLYLLMTVLLFIAMFLYFGYFWSKNGQSLGMKLLHIKVVKTDGSPLSFAMAGLRGTIGYWISGFILGLGYIWAAFDKDKQAWHDKIFGTWVVKA
jgi:uncharacterized RDD family membrane protein YckC